MKKLIFITSIGVNLLFIGRLAYHHYFDKTDNNTFYLNKSIWFHTKNEIYAHFPVNSNQIVFFGNSLTEGFPVDDLFPNENVVNRGVSANTTTNLKDRIESIISGRPKKIFIEGGINDISQSIIADTTLENYKLMLSDIKRISPITRIYIQSILPTSDIKIAKKIKLLNGALNKLSALNRVTFINLYPSFIKGDVINPMLTYDGVHLKYAGYKIWKEEISKFVVTN